MSDRNEDKRKFQRLFESRKTFKLSKRNKALKYLSSFTCVTK